MIYRATFLALIVALLPGALPTAASSTSVTMEATNTSSYIVYATAEKAGVAAFHLYLPAMGHQKCFDTGPYELKGYAVINGLKVNLPNLPLLLSGSAPISLVVAESGKTVVWATRPGGTSSGSWY